MEEFNRVGQYTRGAESLGHFLAMFRASLRQSILICAAIGFLVGTWMFSDEIEADRYGELPTAVAIDLAAILAPEFRGIVTLPNGEEQKLSNIEASRIYAEHFGGRPGGFILRQWFFRCVGSAICVFPFLCLGLIAYGRRLTQAKTLRGAYLIDTLSPDFKYRQTGGRIVVAAVCALAAALSVFSLLLTPEGILALPNLALFKLAIHVDFIAQGLSPNWDGAMVWSNYDDFRGMMTLENAISALESMFHTHSFVKTAGCSALAGVLAGSGAWVLWGARRPIEDSGELEIGGLRIPRNREVYHILVSGVTGSGKSVANKHFLDQIRARKQSAMILDVSGEYVEQYYRKDHDIILNPLDKRCAPWTPWADARTKADFLSLGKSLFPERGEQDKFWQTAGASLFASLTQQAHKQGYASNSQLATMLLLATLNEVKLAISGTYGQRFLDDAAGAMPTNLLATLSAHLESFSFLRDLKKGEQPFSIRDFIQNNEDRWLFFVMRPEDEAAIRPLISMWYDIAINAALALPNEDPKTPVSKRRRVWCFLDELARIQKLPALEGGLREGRKKGLAFVLGLQSMGDIRAAYGRDKAEAILGQPQTHLVLRTVEPDTARWLERLLGNAERVRTQESQSMGADGQRDGVNLQRHTKHESIVIASEIQNLPDLTGYLKMPTGTVWKVAYKPRARRNIADSFIMGEPPASRGGNPLEQAVKIWNDGNPSGALEVAMNILRRAGDVDPALATSAARFIEEGQRLLGPDEQKLGDSTSGELVETPNETPRSVGLGQDLLAFLNVE